MMLLDIPTAYLIVGVLFLLAPASGWLVLGAGPARTVALWCGGGLIFGAGLVLIGGRAVLPVWLSYPTASALTFLGLSMKASALSVQLNKHWPLHWLVPLALLHGAVFEMLRLADLQAWRFAWNAGSLAALFAFVSVLALGLARQDNSRSAKWLALVYALSALHLGLRTTAVLSGVIDPNAASPGLFSVFTAITGLMVSIVGTMGFVGIFLDRARRQELQAVEERVRQDEAVRLGGQIARMERLHVMNELSASLAHELNQPLSAILMNAQLAGHMAARTGGPSDRLVTVMDDIERDTQRASQVLQGIRNLIRPGDTLREPVVLQRVVQEVLGIVTAEARRLGVPLSTHLPDPPVTVEGDPVQLAQVLLNLVLNGLQATQPPVAGGIEIRLWASQGTAVLTVRDHGQGIAWQHLPQLGTQFFTTKVGGTGLGLSIARSLVEQHGGKLTLSNAPDGGAVAMLNLPATTTASH